MASGNPASGHRIFISYAQADKAIAHSVCAELEDNGIDCWIAPRDVPPGTTWASSIIDAITASQLMILVFSSHSNQSTQVLREVERAVAKGVAILPFRVADTAMSKDMEYFLSACHWLDASSQPLRNHLHKLRQRVAELLKEQNRISAIGRAGSAEERPEDAPLVRLDVIEGPMKGKVFAFQQHDTFLFGRSSQCHARLDGDTQVSRHHFLLEVNPPAVRLRDLGSMNGTYVNGVRYGGRIGGEAPGAADSGGVLQADLRDGDRLRVGQTVFALSVAGPLACRQCGRAIPPELKARCLGHNGTYLCPECQSMANVIFQAAQQPLRCQLCGKDLSSVATYVGRSGYVCEACGPKDTADPLRALRDAERAEKGNKARQGFDLSAYTVQRQLGQGGMGTVYLATRADGVQVALKVMRSRVAVEDAARDHFLREVAILKSLEHPNITRLLESGAAGDAFCFVMEYCEAGSVASLMAREGGKLSLSAALPILMGALEGLAFAHDLNFVHRDLKPGNILLVPHGSGYQAKVSDFALAKNFEEAGFSGMTATGEYAGTFPFMPREQIVQFKRVRPVSDVWSIAATFYNMVTGGFPREAPAGLDHMIAILRNEVRPIRGRDSSVPQPIADVIDRALANEPGSRFPTARHFQQAMRQAIAGTED